MRGYWCKYCSDFVETKKKYTRAKIILAFLLISSTFIGFSASFLLDSPINILVGPMVFLVLGVVAWGYGGFSATRFCRICGKEVRKKRIPKNRIQSIIAVQATNMKQAMNIERIKDEEPHEEEKLDQYLERANLFFNAGKYEDSLIYWEKVLKIIPEDTTSWIMMGLSYEKIRDWNKAIESYIEALKIDPSDKYAMSYKKQLEKRIAEIYK